MLSALLWKDNISESMMDKMKVRALSFSELRIGHQEKKHIPKNFPKDKDGLIIGRQGYIKFLGPDEMLSHYPSY